MRLSDFEHINTLDQTIIELQGKLGTLYEQRRALVMTPAASSSAPESLPDLSQIDLTITEHKRLKIGKSRA